MGKRYKEIMLIILAMSTIMTGSIFSANIDLKEERMEANPEYFDYSALSMGEEISKSEYEELKSTYTVGITNTNTPFSYEKSGGSGVVVEIVNEIANKAGFKVKYKVIKPDEVDDCDFSVLSIADTNSVDNEQSDNYANFQFLSIENQKSNKVGTLKSYAISENISSEFYKDQNVTQYDNMEDMVKDFNSGTIGYMFITEYDYHMINQSISILEYNRIPANYYMKPVITYSNNLSSKEIDVINKLITHINQEDAEFLAIKHSALINEKSSMYYLQRYGIISFIMVLVVSALGYVAFKKYDDKKKAHMDQISKLDPLTGMLTEQEFIKEAKRIITKNPETQYSIISLDIDNFKYINEVQGYLTGSKILRVVGSYIQTNAEINMPSARCFADTFLILVETYGLGAKFHGLITKEDALVEEVNRFLDKDHPISFSIGSYAAVDSALEVTYMIDCANIARESGKKMMGTTFNKFSEEMKQKAIVQNDIIAHMNRAIENREFELYYQLKIDLNELQMTGAEALVRWNSDGKVVPPNDFIPIFEENGFIEKLDYYVVREACEFIQGNRGRKFPKISVNISGITMMQDRVIDTLVSITKKHDVDPSEIDIEITESAFVDHNKFAQTKVGRLRKLGFSISMDDFGTGISSLNRLKDIPIDTLKIDREFIVDALDNVRGAKIIKNVIQMSKDLQVETVAEGIETKDQLIFLRDLGCDVGQGFYFSKPLPSEDFLEILRRY